MSNSRARSRIPGCPLDEDAIEDDDRPKKGTHDCQKFSHPPGLGRPFAGVITEEAQSFQPSEPAPWSTRLSQNWVSLQRNPAQISKTVRTSSFQLVVVVRHPTRWKYQIPVQIRSHRKFCPRPKSLSSFRWLA